MRYLNLLALALILLFGGCYPNGAEYVNELDLVLTVSDNEADYSEYSKYVLADSVVILGLDSGDDGINRSRQELILNNINEHMQSYGWVPAADSLDSAEAVVILASVLEVTNVSIINGGWWGYWDWWYGWGYYPPYGGGWYPYYPGYPGYCCYTGIYSYTDGTLILEMLDPETADPDQDADPDPIRVIWGGGINGVLQKGDLSIDYRIEQGLDQMFADSPYLNKN